PSDSVSDLKKPSLVFVRSAEMKPTLKPNSPEDTEETLALAAGTRLVARLQTPVSSAVAAPVVAVVEYNYERNGQIVLAAGSKVFGRLTQVNPSGYVGIQFSRVGEWVWFRLRRLRGFLGELRQCSRSYWNP